MCNPVAFAIGGSALVGGVASSSAARSQASAARAAANAQERAADQATALQRDTANYAISQNAPLSRTQIDARVRQLLMAGWTREQAAQYAREAYAASYQTLPDSSAGVSGPQSRQRGGYRDGEGQWVEGLGEPTSTAPEYDASWIQNWNAADEIKKQPGYDFQYKTGQQALERSRAARGDWMSGDTGTALTQYGQDFASNYWDKMWNQYGSLWGGGSGSGESSQVAINFGNNAANNAINAGNARASSYQQAGQANANAAYGWANSITGAIGAYGNYKNWWGGRP
jgi:hypothetical protein